MRYYTDYKEAIADPDVGMYAVALCNQIGQQVARDVLRSGGHLFMEKPMATNRAGALVLRELAERHDVLIHVDHVLAYHPIIRRIKQIRKAVANCVSDVSINKLLTMATNSESGMTILYR